ncbi:sperm-associated antigen 16 protein-like isoform X2 [Ictalurus furcatus]|uniref:sperm-associated antigen 16 protein-like isoform X2 n=1 Tax=Ictalurus furcatus TaxID=66913 RepID=UPI00235043F7|nr:sperm-associated antigen 16 protein-like isoform X2 [Ictalurus furcatus]
MSSFWFKKKNVPSSVPVPPTEIGSRTLAETPRPEKKKDGLSRILKGVFGREQRIMGIMVHPAAFTESSETPKETLQTVPMKLLGGSKEGQTSKMTKKTSVSRNEKSAERMQVSVKPTSELPGTKYIEVKEADVTIKLQNSVGTRRKKTLPSQERKAAERQEERKEMTPNKWPVLAVDNSDEKAAIYDTESVDGPYYLDKVSIPEDSEDGFEYKEISSEEISVTEEEDLEAVSEILHNSTNDSEFVPELTPSSSQKLRSPIPEVMDNFLRDFLMKMGMHKTLDCFQTEWFEMLHKGTLKTNRVGFIPDIYTHNQLLDNELKNIQKERDIYKQAAFQAKENIVKLQIEWDFHQLHHRHVVQERNRLIEDIQRLKEHYESYGPALKQLNEKYQTAMRQKMLVSIERDRLFSQVHNLDSTLRNSHSSTGTNRFLKDSGCSPAQGTKPSVDEVMTYDPAKDQTKSTTNKHSQDSEFPADTRMNPFLPQIKALSTESTKISGFSVTKSIKAHTMAVSYLALHPRKLLIASASDDHLWRLWGMPEGKMIMTGEGHTDWLSSCSFHPSGHCLATTSGDSTVKIWDFDKSCCVLTLEGHTQATWVCSFHFCGDFVASCSMDNTAKVWDINSERCRYTLRGHVDSVNSVSFVPFSNILLTCSADKSISLWDMRTGLCGQTFYGHRHSCNSATINALGDTIASCDSYGIVKLWDIRTISAMMTVATGPHPCNQVAFSPNGQVLAVASNNHEVKLVDVASSHVSSLLGHNDTVQSVIFDHKGENLLSAGYNGEILIWSK